MHWVLEADNTRSCQVARHLRPVADVDCTPVRRSAGEGGAGDGLHGRGEGEVPQGSGTPQAVPPRCGPDAELEVPQLLQGLGCAEGVAGPDRGQHA